MKPFFLAALLLGTAATSLSAQQIQISKDNRTIAITTSDESTALADVAVVSIGFESYGKDQDGTYAAATATSNAIISALTGSGLAPSSIASQSQELSPLEPSNDQDKVRYTAGMRFEFAQSWHVTVPADQSSAVLHLAITSGANNSGGIEWRLKDDNALQSEAAAKALEHAHQIADNMAKGLGVKLGSLVYASNQTPPRGLDGLSGMALDTESASLSAVDKNRKPLAITPERISRSATVYAVFSIE